ncbi:hypothetical protein QFC19_003415 [Naganishia cerealis]|uniref:Uncharacterized protein n=1 Tax=Naganishia cerealis TaxID=610337 RepID=A0ACC2W3F7_9TREE|nr:hypothetical protein QFC19_003415 [Naganishia cerealis]
MQQESHEVSHQLAPALGADPLTEALDRTRIAVENPGSSDDQLLEVYDELLIVLKQAFPASSPSIDTIDRLKVLARNAIRHCITMDKPASASSWFYFLGQLGVRIWNINPRDLTQLDDAVGDFEQSDMLAPMTEETSIRTQRLFEYQKALIDVGTARRCLETLEMALAVGGRSPGISSSVDDELDVRSLNQHLSLIDYLERTFSIMSDKDEVLRILQKCLLLTAGTQAPERKDVADTAGFRLINAFERMTERSSRQSLVDQVQAIIDGITSDDVAYLPLQALKAGLTFKTWMRDGDSRALDSALEQTRQIMDAMEGTRPDLQQTWMAALRIFRPDILNPGTRTSQAREGDINNMIDGLSRLGMGPDAPFPIRNWDQSQPQFARDYAVVYLALLQEGCARNLGLTDLTQRVDHIIHLIDSAESTTSEVDATFALELRIELAKFLVMQRTWPDNQARLTKDEDTLLIPIFDYKGDLSEHAWHSLGFLYQNKGLHREALKAYKRSLEATPTVGSSAIPSVQAFTRNRLAELHLVLGEYEAALQYCIKAIDELESLVDIGLPLRDMETRVDNVSFLSLGSTAFALALHENRSAYDALKLLEHGRGIILASLTGTRGSFEELGDPSISQRAKDLRLALHPAEPLQYVHTVTTQAELGQLEKSRQAAIEFRQLIQKVREIEGHSRFLRTPLEGDLRQAAAEGPIVLVSAHRMRSDAILITREGIFHRELPNFSETGIRNNFDPNMYTPGPNEARIVNGNLVEALSWLYSTAVRPVLQTLGFLERREVEDAPRVWWIGCGSASHLPFHAAGIPKEKTMDFVISSYAPTLRALLHTRNHAGKLSGLKERFVVFGSAMRETPGMDKLINAELELAAVQKVFKDGIATRKVGNSQSEMVFSPYAADALDRLRETQIAHFACHGQSDLEMPSQSYLALLQRPSGDGDPPMLQRLTLAQLAQTDFQHACIVFLSACSTAQNRVQRLEDEVLHLASGFLVAGFRHAVASMWPVYATYSPDFARVFWETMMQEPTRAWEDRRVAEAVHKATSYVRDSLDTNSRPLIWAPYVHWGA